MKKNKIRKGCLIPLILFFAILIGVGLGISDMSKNPGEYQSSSVLGKELGLTVEQEDTMTALFTQCGIGEITKATKFQDGEKQTSYYLEDAEVAAYRSAEYDIIVWVQNDTKTVNSIYFHDQNIYVDGAVVALITDYYVNAADRDNYRLSAQLAVNQLLKFPDTAEYPAISGWAFGIEDGIVTLQSSVTAKNALNMDETTEFWVKFDNGTMTSLIFGGKEYIQ